MFNSRLPRPLRIGSLDDAAKTEEMLLTLALGPLVAGLEKERIDPASDLSLALAAEKAVAAVENDSLAMGDIALRILSAAFPPDRVPVSKVRPACTEGNGIKVAGLFHHGVVDGNVIGPCPWFGREANEGEISFRLIDRFDHRRQ